MKHWKYDEIDDSALRLKLFGGPQGGKAQKAGKPAEDGGEKYSGSEKHFQKDAESILEMMGYYRRTKENIANPACKAWFLHFPNEHAKGNPIILDIILFNNGYFIEIELKVAGGKLKPHQRQLVERIGAVCKNMAQLKQVVRAWEAGIKSGDKQ